MKKQLLVLMFLALSLPLAAVAQQTAASAPAPVSTVQTTDFSTVSKRHPYDQLLVLQVGPFKPRSIVFTNWNDNTFDYNDQKRQTFLAELGWSVSLVDTGDLVFYFSENLGYSNLSLRLPDSLLSNPGNASVTLHLFSFDSRAQMAWQGSPIQSLVPFVDGGLRYTLYSQSGTSDLLDGEGSSSNWVVGAGLRFWVNRGSSLRGDFPDRYVAIPVFLTAKFNHMFSNNAGVDPSDTNIMGGITVGL